MWSQSKDIYEAKKDALLTGGFEELASQGKDITSIMREYIASLGQFGEFDRLLPISEDQ